MDDKFFLTKAIEKANESISQGGFPAGAIIVKNGEIIGGGISIGNKLNDPTSHGEIAAIRDACHKLQTTDLSGSVLYASMQPCVMCLGTSMWSSISKVVFACTKEKVSVEYYGGHYDCADVNKTFIQPIELVHFAELEKTSLSIVHEWEKNNTCI